MVETTELESNMKDLTSAISAVDLEIMWFKKTDCMCFYKNGQLINYKDKVDEPSEEPERENILPLKNESGVGVYLCKVTCEDRIKEINISLKEAPGTEKQTSTGKLNDKQMNDEERIKMTYSALLTVFSTLQKELQTNRQGDEAAKNLDKQQQECLENKFYGKKDNNASVQQKRKKVEHKEIKPEEKDPRQESTKQKKHKGPQTDRQGDDDQNEAGENLDNQQPGPPEKSNVVQTDRQGDDNLNEAGGNLDNQQPGSLDKSKVLLTDKQDDVDRDEARENLDNQDPGSPDQGQSQLRKSEEESQELQAKKPKNERKGGTVFSILAGKINDIHKKFIVHLQDRIEDLTEAQGVEDSDVVLIFCPIVSRAGTDIDAALAKINYAPDSKLTVLVVLHHTFDPEKTVSDSSKCVNKENLLTVDCLFYEDTGLLHCQRNSDAYDKSVNWLIQQGHTVGSSFQHKIHSSLPRLQMPSWFWRKKQETSGDNKKGFFCK